MHQRILLEQFQEFLNSRIIINFGLNSDNFGNIKVSFNGVHLPFSCFKLATRVKITSLKKRKKKLLSDMYRVEGKFVTLMKDRIDRKNNQLHQRTTCKVCICIIIKVLLKHFLQQGESSKKNYRYVQVHFSIFYIMYTYFLKSITC